MQVISKFEQASSPSSSSSMNLMENITKLLEKGQESAQQIRKLFNEGLRLKVEDDHQADLDHHSKVTLNSIETALSMIKTYAFDQKDKIKKRKFESPESPHSTKTDESGGTIVPKERRGCYKRRRGDESWTVEATTLTDDGHAWRKYGQKEILNTNYPRNYYRCTHKHDQKCQAIKQVQQISENPTKYNIIYHGKHTCQNPNKSPSFLIENPEEKLSATSIYVCFETNNITKSKHALNPSILFPTSSINPDPTPVKVIKQEYTLIKEESSPPLIPIDLDHLSDQTVHNNLQYSSSCSDNHVPSSSDLTSVGLCSTPVSDQGDAISAFDFGTDDDLFNFITLDDHHYNDRLDGMFEI